MFSNASAYSLFKPSENRFKKLSFQIIFKKLKMGWNFHINFNNN